jgi:predicted RNA methylase
MDSLNLEVTNMSQKKNLSKKTDCVICNILQTDLLDEESTNDWLIENYSGKNSEALSITS